MNAIKLRACVWLFLAVGVIYACVIQFQQGSPLQTNLLALLPSTERNPVAEKALAKLASATSNRAVFLIGAASTEKAVSAAQNFSLSLSKSASFKRVIADVPAIESKQHVDLYFQHRFHLLSTADRELLNVAMDNEADLKGRLQKKLYSPFDFGLTLPVEDDPFGFSDNWLANLPLSNTNLVLETDMLVTRSLELQGASKSEVTWVYVIAELLGSAYDSHVQDGVTEAVTNAELALNLAHSDATLLRAGTVFYAEVARRNAEREINLIGIGSVLGALILLYLLFRSVQPLALGLLSVVFGICAAFAVTIEVYGEIHIITLVFGASLIGEAIDYAIQYFSAHLGAGRQWQPMNALQRIGPGLTVALLTSLLGYFVLMLVPFPALSQIGLFAVVGLFFAWLTVFLLLPALITQHNKRDPIVATRLPKALLQWWKMHISKRVCYNIAALILVMAVPGWMQLESDDDVRLLTAKSPLLVSQEEKIKTLTGVNHSSQFFLVEGETVEDLLVNEERLVERLSTVFDSNAEFHFQGVSNFVPSITLQKKNHETWKEKVFGNEAALRKIIVNAGLQDGIADAQLNAFKASENQYMMLDDWLKLPISASSKNLWIGKTSQGFASMGMLKNIKNVEVARQVAEGLTGVTFVDKTGSVSQLLKRYREWGALWLLGVFAFVYVMLTIRYKATKQATVVLAPAFLATIFTLSLFGYLHIPLSLFNIMAFILVLGVGVNYAVFLKEAGAHAHAAFAGVLLSAGTTLLSYGLLTLSSTPLLFSFGITLLIGVGAAILLAPMVISFEPEHG